MLKQRFYNQVRRHVRGPDVCDNWYWSWNTKCVFSANSMNNAWRNLHPRSLLTSSGLTSYVRVMLRCVILCVLCTCIVRYACQQLMTLAYSITWIRTNKFLCTKMHNITCGIIWYIYTKAQVNSLGMQCQCTLTQPLVDNKAIRVQRPNRGDKEIQFSNRHIQENYIKTGMSLKHMNE